MNGLRTRGFDLTVLSALPNYPTGRIFEEYRGKVEDWDEEEKILRTYIMPFKRKSAALRLVTYLSFYNSSMASDRKHFPIHSFDIVIASSPPLFVGLAGCRIAERHKAKFVFDIRDIWPDIAVSMGLMSSLNPVCKWLESIHRRILKSSDLVLVTNCSDIETIAAKGYPSEKIIKIPNGANLNIFKPLPDDQINKLREDMGLRGKFVICYSGSFNQGMNDVGIFIPLMTKLRDNPEIMLLLIGEGENLPGIRHDAERMRLDNIRFMSHQSLEELGVTLNATDVGLIPRKSLAGLKSGGLPVKMFECWALGKPIVMAAGQGTEERILLEETGGGIAVNPGDIDAMADSLRKMKSNTSLTREFGEKGRIAVMEKFNREVGIEKLSSALEKLI